MYRVLLGVLCFLMLAVPAYTSSYNIDWQRSRLTFTGTHAGAEFTGTVTDITAHVVFDVADLANSRIDAVMNLASAHTGNTLYDQTLPSKDWFHTAQFPTARFVSEQIVATGEGFTAQGQLTLKGVTQPVQFYFTRVQAGADTIAHAEFSLNRLDFNIGTASDPDGQWVSPEIGLKLEIVATADTRASGA